MNGINFNDLTYLSSINYSIQVYFIYFIYFIDFDLLCKYCQLQCIFLKFQFFSINKINNFNIP